VDNFEFRNVTNNAELKAQVEQARALFKSVSAEDLHFIGSPRNCALGCSKL
jgi:hypothetical protein